MKIGLDESINTLRKLKALDDKYQKMVESDAPPLQRKKAIQDLRSEVQGATFKSKESLLEEIDSELRAVEEEQREFQNRFGRDLVNELDSVGRSCEVAFPFVYSGMYTLRFDPEMRKVEVALGTDVVLMTISSPTPARIVRGLERVTKEIENRPWDPKKFEVELRRSYSLVAASRRVPVGEKVPINEVMVQMALLKQKSTFLSNPKKENYRGYGRAAFAYDLMRARSSEPPIGFRLHGATQDLTSDSKKYIWVPTRTAGTRPVGSPVSYISFEQR